MRIFQLMAKKTKSVTLAEEDIKVLLKLKKDLFPTDGPISDIAVVRKGFGALVKSIAKK